MPTPIKARRRPQPFDMQVGSPFPPEARDLYRRRTKLIQELRSLEWEWERRPTLITGLSMKAMRVAINELESQLIDHLPDHLPDS